MRMLMKVLLPTPAYNRAIAEGTLGSTWKTVFEHCPPEATYYVNEDGKRAVYAFVDVASIDRIAAVSIPLYDRFEAEVSFLPAMIFADLEKGLSAA